jgi:hypothetical protein
MKIAAARELSLMNGWHAPKRTELTGKDGGPIESAARYEISDAPMSAEEWSRQYTSPTSARFARRTTKGPDPMAESAESLFPRGMI